MPVSYMSEDCKEWPGLKIHTVERYTVRCPGTGKDDLKRVQIYRKKKKKRHLRTRQLQVLEPLNTKIINRLSLVNITNRQTF